MGLRTWSKRPASRARSWSRPQSSSASGWGLTSLRSALLGLDGLFLQVNRRLTGRLGYTESELRELTSAEVTHPDDRGSAVRAFEQLIAGELAVQEMITRCMHRDGQQVDVRLVCRAAPGPDGPAGYLVLHLEDLSNERQASEAVQRTAFQDELTGPANRPALQERLKRSVGGRSVLLIDLDDFKRINDGLGHAMGDEVLTICRGTAGRRLPRRCPARPARRRRVRGTGQTIGTDRARPRSPLGCWP
jgi:PAS domain S-box-containing protein